MDEERLAKEFAQELSRRGITPETVRRLGELAERAQARGTPVSVIESALRKAVTGAGGRAAEAGFTRAVAWLGRKSLPGIGLLLDIAQSMDAGGAGADEVSVEKLIVAQQRLRPLLDANDPGNRMLVVMSGDGAGGALEQMAGYNARRTGPPDKQALLHGLPTIAKLAGGGVREALRSLTLLAQAKDSDLAAAARRELDRIGLGTRSVSRPATPVAPLPAAAPHESAAARRNTATKGNGPPEPSVRLSLTTVVPPADVRAGQVAVEKENDRFGKAKKTPRKFSSA